MDSSEESSKPTQTEHSEPSTNENLIVVKDELMQWIDGKSLDSAESKAFSDLTDLYGLEAKRGELQPPDRLEDDIRTVKETIRQRSNELPGYMRASTEMRKLMTRLEEIETEEIDRMHAPFYGREQGMIPNPKPGVSKILDEIKGNHISSNAQ